MVNIEEINKILKNRNISCDAQSVVCSINILLEAFSRNSKVYFCGNGGSASDSEHIVAELTKNFLIQNDISNFEESNNLKKMFKEKGNLLSKKLQTGFPAISLVSNSASVSSIINDIGSEYIFAQQIMAIASPQDVLFCITTSFNSKNIDNAIMIAKAKKLKIIVLTGQKNNELSEYCDCVIKVDATATTTIQENHIKIYHLICEFIEKNGGKK